jgi:hypothetical protein
MIITNVYVIGAGGTASHFIPNAARMMLGTEDTRDARWIIQDGDDFEERNLERQHMYSADVGCNKAEILASRVGEMVPSGIEVRPDWFGKSQGIRFLYDCHTQQAERQESGLEPGHVLFIPTVDNDATRKELYEAITEVPGCNVIVIDPGNGTHDGQVNTYLRTNQEDVWDSPLRTTPNIQDPKDAKPATGCIERYDDTPQLLVANVWAAALALRALWGFISEMTYPVNQKEFFDLSLGKDPVWSGGITLGFGEEAGDGEEG